MVQDRAISANFFNAAIFGVKRKNAFISETVRDRAILAKLLPPPPPGIYRVIWRPFPKKFSCHTWWQS